MDGSRILLCGWGKGPDRIYVGYYGRSPFDREKRMGSEDGWITEPGAYLRRPRYWMPLPDAP